VASFIDDHYYVTLPFITLSKIGDYVTYRSWSNSNTELLFHHPTWTEEMKFSAYTVPVIGTLVNGTFVIGTKFSPC